jgi:hypothetical protein
MANVPNYVPEKTTPPLVRGLIASVQAEEQVISRIIESLAAGKTSAVIKAAGELAALREAAAVRNCANCR